MDWSRTKTIFIIVFSILNIFLYSIYVSKYNESQQLEIVDSTASVESELRSANIDIPADAMKSVQMTYLSGKTKSFEKTDYEGLPDNVVITVKDQTLLRGTLVEPHELKKVSHSTLTRFVSKYVYKSDTYLLWTIDKTNKVATFFQKSASGEPIYYNKSAMLKIYWNEDLQITKYEQTLFSSLEEFGEKTTLLISSTQAIKLIYDRNYLKQHSTVNTIEIGYSTLVPLTETQVLSPTWHIKATIPVEGTSKTETKSFFVNAIDGQILDIQSDTSLEEQQEKIQ